MSSVRRVRSRVAGITGQCSRETSMPLIVKLTNSSFTPPTRSKYADGFTEPSSLNSTNAVTTDDRCGMASMQSGSRTRAAAVPTFDLQDLERALACTTSPGG